MSYNVCGAPLVSIIIPSYNHDIYIGEAINSVFAQSYRNIELIIIDDGSIDNSKNIIRELIALNSDQKVKFITQDNAGLSKTLNKGVKISSGDYIGFLASDDLYLSNKIEKNIAVLKKSGNNVGAVYSDGYLIDSQGNSYSRFSTKHPVPISKNIYKELLVRNWIAALSVLYKRNCFFSVGGFDENFTTEDYDFFIRFSSEYKMIFIKEALFLYRQHCNNTSNDLKKMAQQRNNLQKKHPEMMQAAAFTYAIKHIEFLGVLKLLSMSNCGHILRRIVRKIQQHLKVLQHN